MSTAAPTPRKRFRDGVAPIPGAALVPCELGAAERGGCWSRGLALNEPPGEVPGALLGACLL